MAGHGLPTADRSGRDDASSSGLLMRGEALHARSAELCASGQALAARIRGHLTRSRRMVQDFSRSKREIVRALVRQQLRAGRLPRHSVPILVGGPGDGGACAACKGPLRMTQLVMGVPVDDGVPTHLHADCYIIWEQQRRWTK